MSVISLGNKGDKEAVVGMDQPAAVDKQFANQCEAERFGANYSISTGGGMHRPVTYLCNC